ncbi:restriction endonuclease subunit S [Plesiomonas shigelloides]|uniref:restriction endonuclease subunit S n=1 Tax=Plesiomonas shigelloides TaxID=703 RepID=UPI000D572626|nr:restriction endonuclease subunit S [Plesiomonas shigelloides]PVU67966.1 restriction endonuclease subunit S [Plesiomonas shigelloides]
MQETAGKAIPAGYQQTEVGVIPHEWNVRKLKEISPSQSVGLVINPSSYYSSNGSIPMLVGSHVSENKIFWSNANKITEESNAKLPASRLNAGDLVTVRVGAPGITAVVPIELDKANCASMMIIRKSDSFDSQWLCYLMNSKHGKACIEGVQYGTAQKQFNIIDAVEFLFPVPPKQEQTAIANVLSDSDALIGSLEQLIAKKQAIKSATMQQLLTGRTRLPQFALRPDGTPKGYKSSELGQIPEDWEVDTIGKVCDLLTGYPFPSNKYSDSGIRLLRGSNVKRGVTDWNSDITQYWPALSQEIKQYELLVGDVVISMDGSLVGRSFAQLTEDDLPAVLLQRVARIRSVQVSQYFLKEWICSPFFTEHCDSLKTVTAIPHISPQDIRDFKLLLPPTLQEQTAIATILSDMDSELNALEQKLAKARDVKQGMMQQLLTGRIRLPLPKEA